MQSKIRVFLSFLLFVLLFCGACSGERSVNGGDPRSAVSNNLVIWTYNSFISEWGPGPEISRLFKEQTGIEINWVSHGNSGAVLSRLLLDREQSGADIIIGIDQNQAPRILESGLLEAYRPSAYRIIPAELILDQQFRLIPFEYSFFAINYDSGRLSDPPRSLEDLTHPRFERRLILIDPRTSNVGLGFFGWVKEVYGDGWQDYWRRLRPSILTITEGWSSAYGLFTKGEAPMVLSYTTSPAYHLEYENSERYKAAIFTDGHPLQIEIAGLLKAAKNKSNAKIFLDFMISPDFQNIIPLTNWMYTVTDIAPPASFRITPKSGKPLRPVPATEGELNEWAAVFR